MEVRKLVDLTPSLLLKAAEISSWIYYQNLEVLYLYLARNLEAIGDLADCCWVVRSRIRKKGDRTLLLRQLAKAIAILSHQFFSRQIPTTSFVKPVQNLQLCFSIAVTTSTDS